MDNIQKTALKETAKAVGAITGIVCVMSVAIALLPVKIMVGIFLVVCLGMGIKVIYDSNLASAKFAADCAKFNAARAKFDTNYNNTVD